MYLKKRQNGFHWVHHLGVWVSYAGAGNLLKLSLPSHKFGLKIGIYGKFILVDKNVFHARNIVLPTKQQHSFTVAKLT